jgi:phosphoadenosine phosphosulfate reductase
MDHQTENKSDIKLKDKELKAIEIIKKGLIDSKNPFILFDGRLESLVILHLVRRVNDGKIPIPVLHIDTTVEFKEIYHYIEKMKKLWGLKLVNEKNAQALSTIKIGDNKEKCCETLKNNTLKNAIGKYNIDRLLVFDDGLIKPDTELPLSNCILIYPIRHFSREDCRDYIKKYNLPHCSLYDKGYYNILCTPCTDKEKIEKKQNSKQDEVEMKKRLKALGYI